MPTQNDGGPFETDLARRNRLAHNLPEPFSSEVNLILLRLMKPILVSLVIVSAVLFTGCNRALVLKTLLESDEKISKGDIVLVDGAAAGTVKRVAVDGGIRAAEFAITDEAAKSKLRVGVVRLREDGRLILRTDAVDAQAPQLANGAMVPLISKPGLAVRQFASSRMWPLLLMGLAIILVALLLFRRMARSWMLLAWPRKSPTWQRARTSRRS